MVTEDRPIMLPPTFYGRYRRTRIHRFIVRWLVWRGTERVAAWISQRTRWAYEPPAPRFCGRWTFRWLGGLYVACWTHACGHGLLYSFRTGCIHWAPRYARRALRLPV